MAIHWYERMTFNITSKPAPTLLTIYDPANITFLVALGVGARK
jgi:hypothetical protein